MQKLKIGDEVLVLKGRDKGRSGKIAKIFLNKKRLIVEGVNKVKKTVKPSQESPEGGIVEIEATIHMSNVAIKCPKTGKASRVGITVKDDKRVRVAKVSNTILA
jgi:large subunit ribosomal protein L24